MSLKIIFEKLYPSYSKKLWKFILDESVHLFIQMLLICSVKYAPEDKDQLLSKIKADKKSMHDLFSNIMSSRDVEPSIAKLTSVEQALEGPPTEIPVHIIKLKVALGIQWNDNCSVELVNSEMPLETQKRHE